jgi:hypothetical protein
MDQEEFNEIKNQRPQRVFALVADGDVFHKWYIDEDYDNPSMAALIYGLQSGPTVVDITDEDHEEIDFGWTYDGQSFYPQGSRVDDE